uniref:Uncharacterized protein n=1 Tax=Aegilops tauschii subsp. strangulata TaxID=200361 RepID=A0A453I8Z2_AEGTS
MDSKLPRTPEKVTHFLDFRSAVGWAKERESASLSPVRFSSSLLPANDVLQTSEHEMALLFTLASKEEERQHSSQRVRPDYYRSIFWNLFIDL